MKIIIAPAKKMQVAPDDFAVQGQPQYLAQTNQILRRLRELTYAEAHQMWRCSDKLDRTNYDWLQRLELTQNQNQTPAVMAYSSLQYQAMAPDLFTVPALAYVQVHLRLLSAFYGVLRPFDGIVPYRSTANDLVFIERT